MNGLGWLLAAALATAPPEATVFPCDKLGTDLLEVYEGFETPAAPPPRAVEVKRKAMLHSGEAALVARTFALADPTRVPGRTLVFRLYRSGAETLSCTRGRSDALFGAGDEQQNFVLRCLADRDGDGRYDAFTRRVALVRAERVVAAAAAPPEPLTLLPLAAPVSLVERPGMLDPTTSFNALRALTRIEVRRVQGQEAELAFSGWLTSVPDHAAGMFRSGSQEAIYTLPMTDGAIVPIGGTRIQFARKGNEWSATVLDGFGRAPRLACSGTVGEVGDTFTILGPGFQLVVPRADLPKSPQ